MTPQWIVGEAEADERLDRALAALAGVPRSQAQRWIEAGLVRCNALRARASQRVEPGDVVAAEPPEPTPLSLEPEAIPLAILFEDQDLVVVDKPAGLVVHPAPGHGRGTLVHALLHHCRDLAGVGGALRPGIVHRLDAGTSGVMVVAKHDAAHHALSLQFRDHTIERIYHAFVRGAPGAEQGVIERAIGRHPRDRKRMSIATRSGREARTAWRVLRRYPGGFAARLEVRPETGRTHQIRVHLASAGLPILGDPVYGRSRKGLAAGAAEPAATRAARRSRAKQQTGFPAGVTLARPALHAALLGFEHPTTGERLRFEAPLPADLRMLDEAFAKGAP